MLRIYGTALELIREVAPMVTVIGRRDPDLAKQVRRALSSVTLNLAEGNDAQGARRSASYHVALGSAREALAGFETARAWGIIGPLPGGVRGKFDAILGTLTKILCRP